VRRVVRRLGNFASGVGIGMGSGGGSVGIGGAGGGANHLKPAVDFAGQGLAGLGVEVAGHVDVTVEQGPQLEEVRVTVVAVAAVGQQRLDQLAQRRSELSG